MILSENDIQSKKLFRGAERSVARAAGRARTVQKSKFTTTECVSPPIVTHGAISTPCTTSLRIPGGPILSDRSDTLYSNAQVQYARGATLHTTHNPVWNSVGWLIDSWHTVPHTIWTIGLVMVHAFCMMEAHLLSIVSSISTDASVTPKAHAIHGFTLVQVATLCTI